MHMVNRIMEDKNKTMEKTKIICYCGSLRVAMEAFKKAEYQSVLDGNIALLPCCMFVDIEREYGAESDYKIKADDLHKRKIDICDEVFVLNVGGYIGNSTMSEIEYAYKIEKPVIYLEHHGLIEGMFVEAILDTNDQKLPRYKITIGNKYMVRFADEKMVWLECDQDQRVFTNPHSIQFKQHFKKV